ncbi:MAG: hypothetical protein R3F20_02795 [Planctomycetota bacterium]
MGIERVGGPGMTAFTIAQFDDSISVDDLRSLARDPRVEVLQCDRPVRDAAWSLINEHFCPVRPDVRLRIYGHYSSTCDLGFARLIPNARHFAADCLTRVARLEALAELRNLESLSLGIYELKDLAILEWMPTSLTSLSLGATRSKRPSLEPLGRFRSIRKLYVEGHAKGIEALSSLLELEDLTLRSITTPDLRYLRDLPNLRSLEIKLGGIRDLGEIEGKTSLRYLEIWQVRGFEKIDVVGRLPGLQDLWLRSMPHIQRLPDLSDAKALRRIVLHNLKGFHDFRALETAPALEEFRLLDGRRQDPAQLLPVLRNPRIRRISAGFGSDRKDLEFLRRLEEHGKTPVEKWGPFEFR